MKESVCSIPALKGSDGQWKRDSQEKANLLAATFDSKCKIPDEESNDYTTLLRSNETWRVDATQLTEDLARKCLGNLNEDSATRPDKFPAKVLKKCAVQLAKPIQLLAISNPELWGVASTLDPALDCCYLQEKIVFDPQDYRGVHMTAQMAKVLERMLGALFIGRMSTPEAIGPNQFAYIKERGSRDALAYLILSWLMAFLEKARVAVYCSDVSGAFDKVLASRLLENLAAKGMLKQLLRLIASWLRDRVGKVMVAGSASISMLLQNMVFQGTVWGPILWNCYYEDARHAINKAAF